MRHADFFAFFGLLYGLTGLVWADFPLVEEYAKARELAITYDLPLVLLFTGSDWSSSSQKILQSIVEDPQFTQTMGRRFIFLKVDFPEKNRLTPSHLLQNEILREKYAIKEFPLLVMLDPEEREITRVGYVEKSAREYAAHLKNLFFSYSRLKREVDEALLESEWLAERMESLYLRAATLGCGYIKEKLMEEGLKRDYGIFFPLEAYAHYVREKEHASEEAQKIRNMIIERDEHNEKKARLRLALLDFQANQENAQDALQFLQSYIETFGKEDLEQLFRLHLLIADYFGEQEKEVPVYAGP